MIVYTGWIERGEEEEEEEVGTSERASTVHASPPVKDFYELWIMSRCRSHRRRKKGDS